MEHEIKCIKMKLVGGMTSEISAIFLRANRIFSRVQEKGFYFVLCFIQLSRCSETRLNMLTINPRAFGFEKDLRLRQNLPPDGADDRRFSINLKYLAPVAPSIHFL